MEIESQNATQSLVQTLGRGTLVDRTGPERRKPARVGSTEHAVFSGWARGPRRTRCHGNDGDRPFRRSAHTSSYAERRIHRSLRIVLPTWRPSVRVRRGVTGRFPLSYFECKTIILFFKNLFNLFYYLRPQIFNICNFLFINSLDVTD